MTLPPYNPAQPPPPGRYPTLPATQSVHPWRATARTVAAALIGLCSLLPMVLVGVDVPAGGVVAQVLAVTGTVTRVLAMPVVDGWLREYVPFLAARPRQPWGD